MAVTTEEMKRLATQIETLKNDVKREHARVTALGDGASGEDRTKLNAMLDAGEALQVQYEDEKRAADFMSHDTPGGEQKAQERAPYGGRKTWADKVLESDAYKNAPTAGGQKRELPPVEVGNFKDFLAQAKATKAIYSSVDAAGGYAMQPDRQPEVLDIARQRPSSVIDLVNKSTTNTDLVEYILMDSRTNNAAVVPERTATGGGVGDDVFGLKPESNMTIDLKTAAVKTIAAYILASRQVLNDAPRLRQMIDDELVYEVEIKLEDTLITDILAWSGIQSRVHATSGSRFDASDTPADTLRRAITDIYLEFYRPDGIVLHPAQGESLELQKDDNNNYMRIYDSATMRLWRVPVLETPAMTSGSALVANFKMAVTVWDREQANILTGQPDDLFLRNAWAILAELRAAWAVTRPKAVEKVTGL